MRGYESKSVDYKGPGKWDENDKKACCELVKDILAMSNSEGGYLVIGVAEKEGKFQNAGLSAEELHSYDTSRVNRFLQNYVDPPINCLVVKEQIDEQTFIVIEVPGFMETPHLCQKEFPGVLKPCGLYVRTDNNESALVQSSADFRRVVERAVRNKQDELLESFRAILTNSTIKSEEQSRNEQYDQELTSAATTGTHATFYKKGVYDESKYEGYREFWCYPSKYVNIDFLCHKYIQQPKVQI
jgi:predicted HTH transcriptional regulator